MPEGDFKNGEMWRLIRFSGSFSHRIGSWTLTLEEVHEKERRSLKELLKKDPSPDSAIQFLAFEQYLKDLSANFKYLLQKQQESPATSLKEIYTELLYCKKRITRVQNRLPSLRRDLRDSSPVQVIGDPAWKNLYSKRTIAPVVLAPSWFAFESWSPEKQKRAYCVILVVQIACNCLHMIQPLIFDHEQAAVKMQQKVIAAVPKTEAQKIDREAAHLGILLTDKYGAEEAFANVAKRHPEPFRRALDAASKRFGEHLPTPSQVAMHVDEYRTRRLVEASPIGNPWPRIGNNWWDLFTSEFEGSLTPTHPSAIAAIANSNPYLTELLTSPSFTITAAKIFKEGNDLLGYCTHFLGRVYTELKVPSPENSPLVLLSKRAREFPRPIADNWKPYPLASWRQSVDNFYEEMDSLEGKPLSQRIASQNSEEWINAVQDLLKRLKEIRVNPFYAMTRNEARRKIIHTALAPTNELKAILNVLTYLKSRDGHDPIFAELNGYLSDALIAPQPHHKLYVLEYYFSHDLGSSELAATVIANGLPQDALEWLNQTKSTVQQFVNMVQSTHLNEMKQRNEKLLHDLEQMIAERRTFLHDAIKTV